MTIKNTMEEYFKKANAKDKKDRRPRGPKHRGITYPQSLFKKWGKKTHCAKGMHLFDEVTSSSTDGRYLTCDVCGFHVFIRWLATEQEVLKGIAEGGFLRCVDNKGFEKRLKKGKLYEYVYDRELEEQDVNLVRVSDETHQTNFYPAELFRNDTCRKGRWAKKPKGK